MRRSAATTWSAGAPPFTVGQDPLTSPTNIGPNGYLYVTSLNPAPRSGLLTAGTVSITNAGSRTFTILTGTVSGSTLTVKQVNAPFTPTNGLNTLTGLSLPIAAGDMLAFWCGTGTPNTSIQYDAAANNTYRSNSTLSFTPTMGQNVSVIPVSGTLILQATGS